jgi:hypothetical protein
MRMHCAYLDLLRHSYCSSSLKLQILMKFDRFWGLFLQFVPIHPISHHYALKTSLLCSIKPNYIHLPKTTPISPKSYQIL